jgi:hypothetical protein
MNRAIISGLGGLLFFAVATLSAQMPDAPQASIGCGEAQPQTEFAKEKPVTIEGVLTNGGVECPALRTDDGTLYTLNGNLKKFKEGDRVEVVGDIADISICQQGIAINVHHIKRA